MENTLKRPVKASLSLKPRWLHGFGGGTLGRTEEAHQFKEALIYITFAGIELMRSIKKKQEY